MLLFFLGGGSINAVAQQRGRGRWSHSGHLDLCSQCPSFQPPKWKTILQCCSALPSQDETWVCISSAECWDPGGLTLHPLHPISKKRSKGSCRTLETRTVVNTPARHLFSLSFKMLMAGISQIAAQSGENRWTNRNPYFCRFGLPSFGKREAGCSMKCYSKQCWDSSSIKILVPLMTTAIFPADDSTKERVACCPGIS